MYSDNFSSDLVLTGDDSDRTSIRLKPLTQDILKIIKTNKTVSYIEILKKLNCKNLERIRRRVYDVLSVMRALNLIKKDEKDFSIIDNEEEIYFQRELKEREEELKQLRDTEKTLRVLAEKNKSNEKDVIKAYPIHFFIIAFEENAVIEVYSNINDSIITFKSNELMDVYNSMEIIKEIYDTGKDIEND